MLRISFLIRQALKSLATAIATGEKIRIYLKRILWKMHYGIKTWWHSNVNTAFYSRHSGLGERQHATLLSVFSLWHFLSNTPALKKRREIYTAGERVPKITFTTFTATKTDTRFYFVPLWTTESSFYIIIIWIKMLDHNISAFIFV